MEHVKIRRILVIVRTRSKLVQKIHCDLFLRMSKGAHITVVAGLYPARVTLAELHFVFFGMIKLLHSIMCS
jgi:hypothetical protein